MNTDNKDRWWDIFTDKRKTMTEDNCPAVPVASGQAWQKSLANLYCPCKSDSTALECQMPLF